jgi:hypothetical protein
MNLTLVGIENVGDLERERVVLRATAEVDIGRYAIFRCNLTSDKGVAAGHVPSAYWFPDRKLKQGDFVVLYSKMGTSSEKTGNGSTSYFFYWGWKSAQWPGHRAALVNTATWQYSPPPQD